jgi:hypothetical protein
VAVTETLTTLGATFFTTGAKLLVTRPSRETGESFTSRRKGAFVFSFACVHGVNISMEPISNAVPPSSDECRQENV